MNQKLTIASSTSSGDHAISSQRELERKNLLTCFIHHPKVTNALELLEGFGFRGEIGIFMLSAWEVL